MTELQEILLFYGSMLVAALAIVSLGGFCFWCGYVRGKQCGCPCDCCTEGDGNYDCHFDSAKVVQLYFDKVSDEAEEQSKRLNAADEARVDEQIAARAVQNYREGKWKTPRQIIENLRAHSANEEPRKIT